MISGKAIRRGNWWHIGWNENGRWMQKSTHIRAEGNNPPPEVNRLLADIQEKLKCFKTGEEYIPKLLVSEAFLEWSKEDAKISKEGTWKYRQTFVPRTLGEEFFKKMVAHVNEGDVMSVIGRLNQHGMAYQTKLTVFASCASFWDFCVKKGYSKTQFFHKFNKKKIKGDMEPRLERRALTDEEWQKIYDALSRNKKKWPLTCAMIGYWTGARISEAIQLRKDNFFFYEKEFNGNDNVSHIRIKDIKRGGVIMEKVVVAPLKNYLTGLPDDAYPDDSVDKQKMAYHFQNAAREAGVPNATFHWLRHTLASRLCNEGIEERLAAKIIGHSEAVHKAYSHASKKVIYDKLSQLPAVEVLSSFGVKNDKIMPPQATLITDKEASSL
ncbi:MAG: hypothetical protein EBR82_24875 [Caulobacteraceae bacterium]|nr:hypothetical protein [Caulobacteraceae bacterium]